MRPIVKLFWWWFRHLRTDAVFAVRQWSTEPEWPLLAVAVPFMVSFFVHWLGYRLALHRVGFSAPFFAPTEWEGRTGWRKPLVFGISNAMVFASLREALASQQLVHRSLVSHLVAWATAIEVGIITVQAWRGVGSHFNVSTSLDATLYCIKLCGAAMLGLGCFAAALGFTWRPAAVHEAKAIALRHGLWSLCIAVLVGVGQAVFGHLPRQPHFVEDAPCLVVTAAASASPCYEIHGQAIVKLAHFLPLHVTEVLLILAWAASYVENRLGPPAVRSAALGCWLLTCLGFWMTVRGESIKSPTAAAATVLSLSLGTIAMAFVFVIAAPLFTDSRQKWIWHALAANTAAVCSS